jgi:predicted nucleotidyltransferase
MKIDVNRLRAFVKSRGLTNTNLAAKAGISRQALQAMLRQNQVVEVRDRTVKGLVQALRLADEGLLSPDPLAGYKKAVADKNADLNFAGLGLPTTDPKSMDDVYIPVKVVPVSERDHDDGCSPSTNDIEDKPIEESDELKVDHCLALHRRALIRGEPGSGKTTALRHAAREYALGLVEASHPGRSRLPLMVRLADFAKAREHDGEMTLVRFVVTRTLGDASSDYWTQVERNIETELRRGACLVLLDGLDEVGANVGLFPVLSGFVNEFGKNHFVVTSRIVGLDPEPWRKLGFATFQVTPWREEEIREFTRRWYAARPVVGNKQKKHLEHRAEELTALIMSHRPLRAIASNPLMLTILAALHYANAALPRRRVDLYAKIVEVMLETWEATKRGARPGDPLHGIVLESREFGWLLGRLALQMQREGRILRPRWWVNDCVQQFLREQMALDGNVVKEQSERVIRYLCERTGLLVERGDGTFGFGHRTLQEYFAARGLVLEADGGDDLVSMLRPYLFHPQWEEVVIYVAASISAPRATILLRVILDDPNPAGRFLRRGQRLALRCLVNGAAVSDRTLLNQIFSDGEAIGRSRWPGIALDFISSLKLLLMTRHETEAKSMLSAIEEGAKRDLSDADYFLVYSLLHEPPKGPKDDRPGTICPLRLGGRQINTVWPAWNQRFTNPDAWFADAVERALDRHADVKTRIAVISLFGDEAEANDQTKKALKKLLLHDRSAEIRAECAQVLGALAAVDLTVVKLLLNRLDNDESDVVRANCAEALRVVAPRQTEVRIRLEKLLESGSDQVRAGAVEGLSRIDLSSPDQLPLLQKFITFIASSEEPTGVRCACISAIAPLLGRGQTNDIDSTIEKCLDDQNSRVRAVALHTLADAISEGRKEWSPVLIEKIERSLMAVAEPCVHLFNDLVTIVALRETQGEKRVERLLSDALMPFDNLVRIAFVFGSVARREQVRESDIDLMVIGDVHLKDIASALHMAEQTLGRPINPVLFSADKFREQYRQGNPLLLDVVRKDKIFLKGNRDELTNLVADGVPG